MRLGVIDTVAASPEEAVAGASIVLLAAPVRSMGALLRAMAPALTRETTVMDVGSVKAGIVAAAADAKIFAGRVCFICPSRNALASATAAAHAFWIGVGCQTATIEPDTHDRLMAAQSHLPHVAAFALAGALISAMSFLESTTTAASPTTSLRDTTRIAASGPAVWRDILLANATHVLPLIQELETRVVEIKLAVAAGDGESLERILADAQSCRRRLVKE